MNVWFQVICPKCLKTNWLDNGDPSDLSKEDVEVCECWDCGSLIDLETEQIMEVARKSKVPGCLPEVWLHVDEGREKPE